MSNILVISMKEHMHSRCILREMQMFVENREMIDIETLYFSFSKTLLRSVGLWPHQHMRLIQLQYILSFGILLTVIVFHFTTFMTAECTSDLIVKVLASMFVFINIIVKYSSFWVNRVTMKILLEQLQKICSELKDENELAIIAKYGNISRSYTIWFTVHFICGESFFILIQSWSSILDFVRPQNESRPRIILFPMEYFVDQQRYFCLILLHINIALCIAGITLVGALALLFACQECVCGMFTIANYRIKYSMRYNSLRNVDLTDKNLISERITRAVDIHRKAMKYSKFLMSRFEVAFGFLTMTVVITLTLNLFRIFQIMSSEFNIMELILPVAWAISIILYMFLVNYIGQDLTDHHTQIFVTVYNIQWYKAPLHVQKSILFLLQKGSKDFTLTVGSIINGSLKSFAMLTNTSISYFTVLYSTQK
ncbi:uncharacterized protein LOC109503860 isoform X1 [Harpegnathos saltator]|uniref:uncharacterized protein LOC109503860 isoform X1 n=1 Tax=Harpegnathos saltator TaxID=610380 RepID=UPI00094911D3|nr:uncharacterized protein LOC109503860 isoform X1 [Harpegnathos saltator]